MIKEFKFVDTKRLNMFYEQIGPPIVYDKVAEVGGGLAITGPRVAATQKRHAREPTQTEKIEALIAYLRKEKRLIEQRPLPEQRESFVLETCTATRLNIPGGLDDSGARTPEIVLWLSLPTETSTKNGQLKRGLLCLFESYQGTDEDKTPLDSEFSLFVSLLYTIHQDGRNRQLLDAVGLQDLDAMSFDKAWSISMKYIEVFHQNPVATLKRLGCRPGHRHKVEVFYKVRETDIDWATRYATASVFGYPIYIAIA